VRVKGEEQLQKELYLNVFLLIGSTTLLFGAGFVLVDMELYQLRALKSELDCRPFLWFLDGVLHLGLVFAALLFASY